MGILMIFLSIILLGVCVFLIFLVLSQDVKGGGLAGALGGGAVQGAFGGRSAESITKLTRWVAIVFFLLVLTMGLLGKKEELGETDIGRTDEPTQEGGAGN